MSKQTKFLPTSKWTVKTLDAVFNEKYLEVGFGGGHQINLIIHNHGEKSQHIALGKKEAKRLIRLLLEYILRGDNG